MAHTDPSNVLRSASRSTTAAALNPAGADAVATEKVRVDKLRLDRDNPRLMGRTKDATDEAIIAQLYSSAELDELLQSISTSGYLDIEPLVAMPTPAGDEMIVLEGNRRLATLRLLREPALAKRIADTEGLRISVPEVEDRVRSTLDSVTVYRVECREDAREFIGFKHINGAAKWDAYAKARFAADWYQRDGVSLQQVAKAIGDRHATVKRMVSAICVLEQASNEGLFEIRDRDTPRFSFSHLYTALSRSQYMDYLGLEPGWANHDPDPKRPEEIPQSRLEQLKKVLVWIYGSRTAEARPVVRVQNPDIKRLGEVLAHAEALHVLEQTNDLSKAHSITEPIESRLASSLIHARDALRDAFSSLSAYDGRDQSLLDIASNVQEAAETVVQRMKKKREDCRVAE